MVILTLPKLSLEMRHELWGCFIMLASASIWALGCFAQRRRRTHVPALVTAAYQMLLGGASMTLLGVYLGEGQRVGVENITPNAIAAFLYLLVVGSLVGYVAFNWLLGHVSTTVVGTYAYVNPIVALVVGHAAIGEDNFNVPVVSGMLVTLAGVALVKGGVAPAGKMPTVIEEDKFSREPRERVASESARGVRS